MPVKRDAPLAPQFGDGKKLLQPLIFSHGLTSHKMNYSGICRELASYGFLVIALNHNDRSGEYTTGQEKTVTSEDGETTTKREVVNYDRNFPFGTDDIRHP